MPGDDVTPSAFRFPSTGSGVFLGVPSRSLVASAWHDAWNARFPTSTVSSQTHSCAVSSHLFSNRSWQIGHTLLIPLLGSGTGMYLGLAASAALPACSAESSSFWAWSESTISRDLIQSWAIVSRRADDHLARFNALTYLLVNVPAAVHASFLSLCAPLVYLEVPVHMRRLLLLALIILLESSPALRTRGPQFII